MERRWGNGKIWKWENMEIKEWKKRKRNGRKKGIMITITYWEWFSIRDSDPAFIFFKFDIQYIDKCSIERKCIPYIPENGKPWTISKDNVIGIWRVWAAKPIEAHTSPWGHGLHRTMVWYTGTFLIAVPSRSDLKFPLFLPYLPFSLLKSCISLFNEYPIFSTYSLHISIIRFFAFDYIKNSYL